MQYAEKAAWEDREYKRIQRPAAAVTRGALSLDLKRILEEDTEDDDKKVKKYITALHRYVNVRDKIPDTEYIESNPITPRKQ